MIFPFWIYRSPSCYQSHSDYDSISNKLKIRDLEEEKDRLSNCIKHYQLENESLRSEELREERKKERELKEQERIQMKKENDQFVRWFCKQFDKGKNV